MDAPLLGGRPTSLFRIPEEDASPPATVLSASPSMIRDRIIYGPDSSPRSFFWRDLDRKSFNDAEALPLRSPRCTCVCTCGSSLRPLTGASTFPNTIDFDDSFVDSSIIDPERHAEDYGPDLMRMDLDMRSPKFSRDFDPRSPRFQPPSPMAGDLFTRKDQLKEVDVPPSYNVAECAEPGIAAAHWPVKFHRSLTAPAIAVMSDVEPRLKHGAKQEESSRSSPSVVSQTFLWFLLYLGVGVALYAWKEDEFSGTATNKFIDALYFCIVTMCTIGYGDITPSTNLSKIFACIFVLVGFGLIDILLTGMVNYILDRQEEVLLTAVRTGHYTAAQNYLVDIKKGRMRIRLKVTLAFGVVVLCIGVGTFFMRFVEDLGWLDSFYLSCMSVTTVGYGDHAFTTMEGRLFAIVWLLVSTLAVARSFVYLAEARVDKRHRLLAKRVLEKDMTFGDLIAADIDNDGSVSKSDFVVYKLKQMGKIEEKDVTEICKQFSRLDPDNSGRITLSNFLELHKTSPLMESLD